MYETTGQAKAYEYLYHITGKNPLTLDQILVLHRLFYQEIDEKQAGVLRDKTVFISRSNYPVSAPGDLSREMNAFVAGFNKTEGTIHPVKFAALVHQKFVFIHPFIDGNGRVARLLMNLALLRSGFTIAVIYPVLRQEYNACLERAHENTDDFFSFIARSVIETEKELLRLIEGSVSEFPDAVYSAGSERINERINTVYSIISEHPGINTNVITELYGKSIAAVNCEIAKLKTAGRIEFRGAKKNGGYFSVRE
ncbi:MAG TPA: Fic family protein [Methanocorpusculum sp.]|nr:Fic family protein [Methanocorpusculum sp.]